MSLTNESIMNLAPFSFQGAPLEATLLSIATAATVLGNLGTLAAFATDSSLRQKPSNLFLASLSAADFLMGLFVLPLRATETAWGFWPLKEAVCMVQVFFADIALTVAIYTVTAISVDRLLLVSQDYSRYLAMMSQSTVRFAIAFIWLGVTLSAVLEIVLWGVNALPPPIPINFDYSCLPPIKFNQIFLVCIFIFGFFVPLFIMIVCSLGFMFYLRKRLKGKIHAEGEFSAGASAASATQRRTAWTTVSASPPRGTVATAHGLVPLRVQPAASSVNDATSTVSGVDGSESRESRRKTTLRNRYLKPAITMAAILLVFVACTLPYLMITAILAQICPLCYSYELRVHIANLMFANSCINPILYAATQSKIRQFYRTHVFRCFKRRP